MITATVTSLGRVVAGTAGLAAAATSGVVSGTASGGPEVDSVVADVGGRKRQLDLGFDKDEPLASCSRRRALSTSEADSRRRSSVAGRTSAGRQDEHMEEDDQSI